jgi:hypothetical protein
MDPLFWMPELVPPGCSALRPLRPSCRLLGAHRSRLVLNVAHLAGVDDPVVEDDRDPLPVHAGVHVVLDQEALDRGENPALHHLDVPAGVVVLEHVVHVPCRVRLPQTHRPCAGVLLGLLFAGLGPFEQPDHEPAGIHGGEIGGTPLPGPSRAQGLRLRLAQDGVDRVDHVWTDDDPQVVVLVGEADEQ